jgi:hypothetical protein
MAEIDEKVLHAVEAALSKNPKTTLDELFEVAKGVNPAIGSLNKRQFHARYPLQIKRKLAPPRPRRAKRAKGAPRRSRKAPSNGSIRDAVRASLIKFAADLAGAEARQDIVRVVAGVDRYVDEILKATGSS